ncbi:MAG: ThuA domain-containing protein [Phycisphaerae bacterium]|nr:ThuA domain-containing protein [Phycisphaerae bacterium]
MARDILIVLGGAHHDFEGFEAAMGPLLQEQGYAVEATYDHDVFTRLDALHCDAVLLYTSLGDAFDGTRYGRDLAPEQIEALRAWVRGGKGLLGVHSASVCCESNAAHRELIGGRFAKHPKPFSFTVYPRHCRNAITHGLSAFTVFDEFYFHQCSADIDVCLAAVHEQEVHPMGWTRREGAGRVAYLAPGHFAEEWAAPTYRTILLRMLAWCATGSTDA